MERRKKISLERVSAESPKGFPELRVGGGEEDPARSGAERIRGRDGAHCMAVTERGAPCKSAASWPPVQGELETLVCGAHLKRFEKSSKGIGRIEKLADHGFNLKRREESDDLPGPLGVVNRGGE